MRKDLMRTICLMLCLVLCLGGTAMASDGKVAMGRYMEHLLTYPGEGSYVVFAQTNGAMYALSSDARTLYVSKDGKEWEKRESGHDEAVCPMDYVSRFCVGPDGSLYLVSTDEDREQIKIEHIKDGKSELVPLELDQSKRFYFAGMAVTDSGDMLILDEMSQMLRFSPDGKLVKKYSFHGAQTFATRGNELAVYERDAEVVTIVDVETGEVLRKLPVPDGANYDTPLAYGPDGTLYMATKLGIFTVTAGGSLMTQMLDGNLTSLSKPSFVRGDLVFDADGDPVVILAELNTWQYSLFSYKFDASIPTEPTTQISVFTLYDNATLRQAIPLLQAQNPEAKVNMVVALAEGTAITRDDAIRTLNTEILAGKGPDVLVLDGLPIQSYIDKGALLDLLDVIRPLIDEGKLLKNVASAFEANGAIRAVPTRFLLPTLWGDFTGIDSMADIAGWARENPDKIPAFGMEPEDLIDEFYLACAPTWKGENGRLDEAKMAEFLTLIKDIRGDWNYEKVSTTLNFDYKAMLAQASVSLTTEWNPYEKDYGKGRFLETYAFTAKGNPRFFPYVVRGMEDATRPNGVINHLESGAFMQMPGQVQNVYLPNLALGVNAGSANAELAKKFVLQMLSDEVQLLETMSGSYGFPINEAALNTMLANTESPTGSVGAWGTDAIDLVFEDTWLDEEQRKQLREIFDVLSTPSLPDFTLHQMVVEQSAPFFEGKTSAEETAATIAAKANAYLSE